MSALSRKFSFRLSRHFPRAVLKARGFGPLVSFTLDDAPVNAATQGAPILAEFGIRGTFYLSGGWMGGQGDIQPILDAEAARHLAASGHEIGCHTFSHCDVAGVSGNQLIDDLDRNRDHLRRVVGVDPVNFAYPYGMVNNANKRILEARFSTCRGILPGLNEGAIDLGMLSAILMYGPNGGFEALSRWIAYNVRRAGWLVFVTHDVRDHPSPYGTPPDLLRRVIEAALQAGCDCLTVDKAIERIRRHAQAPAAQPLTALTPAE